MVVVAKEIAVFKLFVGRISGCWVGCFCCIPVVNLLLGMWMKLKEPLTGWPPLLGWIINPVLLDAFKVLFSCGFTFNPAKLVPLVASFKFGEMDVWGFCRFINLTTSVFLSLYFINLTLFGKSPFTDVTAFSPFSKEICVEFVDAISFLSVLSSNFSRLDGGPSICSVISYARDCQPKGVKSYIVLR